MPGWFDKTIPLHLDVLAQEGIAFLRIDADWYDPVLYVLEHLAPLVSDGGLIILDDYYVWAAALVRRTTSSADTTCLEGQRPHHTRVVGEVAVKSLLAVWCR